MREESNGSGHAGIRKRNDACVCKPAIHWSPWREVNAVEQTNMQGRAGMGSKDCRCRRRRLGQGWGRRHCVYVKPRALTVTVRSARTRPSHKPPPLLPRHRLSHRPRRQSWLARLHTSECVAGNVLSGA